MPITVERPGGHAHVAVVTLDRPERANALDPEMLCELAAAWRELSEDPEVRVVVVTGAGDRVFCSGMDMHTTIPASQALARGEQLEPRVFEGLRNAQMALLAGFDLGKPLICAVNGHARAGGFDMLLAAELRFSVPEATFALEEVARGLYPTGNSTVLLARQIGWVHAHELLLTAEPIPAERALAIGLINRIVKPGELMGVALETADRIAANAPLAVRATRAGVRELLHLPLREAFVEQERFGRPIRSSEDAREGQRAFSEKRRPHYVGR